MKLKKLLFSGVMLTAAAMLSLSGCGGNKEESSAETQETEQSQEAQTADISPEDSEEGQSREEFNEARAEFKAQAMEELENENAASDAEERTDAESTAAESADTEGVQEGTVRVGSFVHQGESGDTFGSSYGFSDGCTWIGWTNESGTGLYLVNTAGEVVYYTEEEPQSEDAYIVWNEWGKIQDGATYAEALYQPYDSSDTKRISVLLDTRGNELRRFVSGDSDKYDILGYEDGIFLVMDTRMDIDGYATYLFSVGTDGETVSAPKLIEGAEEGIYEDAEVTYLGENIYYFNDIGTFYNVKTGALQQCQTTLYTPLGKFYDGTIMLCGGGSGEGFIATLEDFAEDRSNLTLTNVYPDKRDELARIDISDKYVGGHFYSSDEVYTSEGEMPMELVYDLDGNQLDWTEPYMKYNSYALQPLEDGNTFIMIDGKDDRMYFTMLDNQGQEMYEPILWGDYEEVFEQNGYLLFIPWDYDTNLNTLVIYPDGTQHSLEESLPEIAELTFGPVGDGYIFCRKENEDGSYSDEPGSFVPLDKSSGLEEISAFRVTENTNTTDLTVLEPTLPEEAQATDTAEAAEQTAAETAAEAAEESGSASGSEVLKGSLDGLVLFEQDGVGLYTEDEHYFRFVNSNPENKIAELYIDDIYYNGLKLADVNMDSESEKSLQSGEEESFYLGVSEEEYRRETAALCAWLTEIPIETVTYHFRIKVGTGSEEQSFVKTVQLPSYKEEDMNTIYGEKLGEFQAEETEGEELPDLTMTAYRLETDKGIAVIYQNNSDYEMWLNETPRWIINGEMQETGLSFDLDRVPSHGAVVVYFEESADSVRKRMELTNDTPVTAQLTTLVSYDQLEDEIEDHQGEGLITIDVGELK